jgi:hypothetical protein
MSDLIKAAKLWAKTSSRTGGTYYLGRMGGVRVLILENRDRRGEDEPTHWLLLGDAEAGQERDPARRSQARRAEAEQEREPRSRPEPSSRSGGTAAPGAPAKPSARPVGVATAGAALGVCVPPAREPTSWRPCGRRRAFRRGRGG